MNKLIVVAASLLLFAPVLLPVMAFAEAANTESNALSPKEAKALFSATKKLSKKDPEAMFALANMYADGVGVRQDQPRALSSFKKAAKKGHAGAQYELALRHLNRQVSYGLSVTNGDVAGAKRKQMAKRQVNAAELFRQSADQGYAPAQYALGQAYLKGEGVTRSTETGIDWLSRAGAQGLVDVEYKFEGANYWGSEISILRNWTDMQECARSCEQDSSCVVASYSDQSALAGYANTCVLRNKVGPRHTEQQGIFSWVKPSAAPRKARVVEPIGPASTGQEPATLAVLTLYNWKDSGTEAELEAATQSIVDGLTEQYGLSVSRWTRPDKVLHNNELRPIAKKSGARYVFQGFFERKRGRIEISVLFYDVRARPYPLWSDSRRTGEDRARDGVTGQFVKVDRDLSWVIDEFTRKIYKTIDSMESARPPPTHFTAVSDGQVVADSPDAFGERGGLNYLRNSTEPFTGVIKRWWPGERLRYEKHYVGGRLHGSYKEWREDGQVRAQGNMIDGKREGQWYLRSGMRIDGYCYRDGIAYQAVPQKACE